LLVENLINWNRKLRGKGKKKKRRATKGQGMTKDSREKGQASESMRPTLELKKVKSKKEEAKGTFRGETGIQGAASTEEKGRDMQNEQ